MEQIESRAVAFYSALVTRGVEIDMWAALEQKRAEHDELLNSDPPELSEMDAEEMELRRILGVG